VVIHSPVLFSRYPASENARSCNAHAADRLFPAAPPCQIGHLRSGRADDRGGDRRINQVVEDEVI